MSRVLYRVLVHLHPRGFRDRFEDEMLAVYDDAVVSRGAVGLIASTLVSLFGQWLRPSRQNGIPVSPGTMRAFEICRTRQRLDAAVSSLGLVFLAVLLVQYRGERVWPFLGPVIIVALWGIYGLARVMWQRVRSPQEYGRARPGLREELERKVEKHRVHPGQIWFYAAMLVVCVALFLRYPQWRQWNDLLGRWLLACTLTLWHLWLRGRLAQTLRRELEDADQPKTGSAW